MPLFNSSLRLYSALILALTIKTSLSYLYFQLSSLHCAILLGADIALAVLCLWLQQQQQKKALAKLEQHFLAASNGTFDCQTRSIEGLQATGLSTLNDAFAQYQAALEKQLNELALSASRLKPMSLELADTYSTVTQKAKLQATYGNTVADVISKMCDASTDVHKEVDEMTQSIDQGSSSIQGCRQTLDKTVTLSQVLADDMGSADKELKILVNHSEAINSIIGAINDIAEQTNLLALNAAIEAARAGEQGRGFAVVADEVRALSKRTADSTSQVQSTLQSIQKSSKQLETSISTGVASAEQNNKHAHHLEQQLQELDTVIHQVQNTSNAIQSSVDTHSQTELESRSAVEGLTEINKDALECINMHSLSSDDLVKLSQALKDKFAKFETNTLQWDEAQRPVKPKAEMPAASAAANAEEGELELF